jgi:hypothetical protein
LAAPSATDAASRSRLAGILESLQAAEDIITVDVRASALARILRYHELLAAAS